MSTQTRLDAYLAAELSILEAQEIRGGDRTHRMAELVAVQKKIDELQRQLDRETAASNGSRMRFKLANLNRTG